MMEYLPQLALVAGVHLLAVMSPGPDFVMIVRNSLIYSRRSGIFSAIGLGGGIFVHVVYSLIGIGWIISRSVLLFSIIKWIGALYLIYIGWKSLRAKPVDHVAQGEAREAVDLTAGQAIRMGFLTNVLNPKATLFFLGLFSQVIDPMTPLAVQVVYGAEMVLMTILWFSGVAVMLSSPFIRQRFSRIQHRFEQAMGALLIALGIKVALSSNK